MEKYLLGIDIGTSAVKVVLFTPQGDIVASSNQAVPIYSEKPDYAEQDMEEVWRIAAETVRSCLARAEISPALESLDKGRVVGS